MRQINKQISLRSVVDVVKTATSETIVSIVEDKRLQTINVTVEYTDATGQRIKDEQYEISNGKYELLMSESPVFAPNKPLNEYREEDIWHIVDIIRTV